MGPATPTLLIKASIFLVFFLTFSKKSETWYSFDASQRYANNFLLINGCLLNLLSDLLSISQRYTIAPLARQTFAVAKPIPDAPADIIIFYFLMIG